LVVNAYRYGTSGVRVPHEKRVIMRCVRCGHDVEHEHVTACHRCGGTVDPVYDLRTARIGDEEDSLLRYFDILPLESRDAARGGFAPTPLLHARDLGHRYGLEQLFLKDETGHPTCTTKDRMAACTLSRFSELGINEFVASSTGNSSTSFAYWVSQYGGGSMRAHLFSGADWARRHQHCDHDGVSLHVIDGTFVGAGAAAKQFAFDHAITWEGGFFNPARREGLKLAYLEAFDQLPREPSVVIQAISSGMGLYGCWRGINEYQQLGRLAATPRLVCVQQESCAPMVRCFEHGSREMLPRFIVPNPSGIAEAILRGDPSGSYPYMYSIVTESGGAFVSVSSDEIEVAQLAMEEDEGVRACPASSAAVAAAQKLRHRGWIDPDDVVVVNVAGGIRPEALAGANAVTADAVAGTRART
jgi:threonine synthase